MAAKSINSSVTHQKTNPTKKGGGDKKKCARWMGRRKKSLSTTTHACVIVVRTTRKHATVRDGKWGGTQQNTGQSENCSIFFSAYLANRCLPVKTSTRRSFSASSNDGSSGMVSDNTCSCIPQVHNNRANKIDIHGRPFVRQIDIGYSSIFRTFVPSLHMYDTHQA